MTPKLATHIIGLLWAATVLYWVVRAFGNKRARVRGRAQGAYVLLLVVVAMVITRQRELRVHLFAVNSATEILGILICTAGLGLAFWARIILGRNWSGLVVIKEGHELIQSGPYQYVRHPLYTGLIVGMLGTVIALSPTGTACALLVAWVVAFSIKSRSEERAMTQEFGEQYAEYRKRVRWAILPFVF